MTKPKRKNVPGLQDLIDRPICYYCEKDFEDLAYLIDHQKAKHFKCDHCSRRLNTAGGLNVHMSQVHKEKLERVANAMEGREKPDLEIFGMEGFPPAMLEAHKQRVTNEYFRREAAHRARTGNPPPGTGHGPENTKRKETIEETKKRLAEFKAKKAAAKAGAANGSGSDANTPAESAASPPVDADQQASLPNSSNLPPHHFNTTSPHVPAMLSGPFPPPHGYEMPIHSPYQPMTIHVNYPGVPTPSNFPGAASPPVPPASMPRQNSLPAPPGLPPRPTFDSPSFSKEAMAKLHSGHNLPPIPAGSQPPFYGSGPSPPNPYGNPNPPYAIPNAQYAAPYPSNGASAPQWGPSQSPNGNGNGQWLPPYQVGQQPGGTIRDQVDELIESVTGGGRPTQAAPSWHEQPNRHNGNGAEEQFHHVPQDPSSNITKELHDANLADPKPSTPAPAKASKKKDKKDKESTLLKYSDLQLSPEEKYATKWHIEHGAEKPIKHLGNSAETVLVQAGENTQAVAGPVDDDAVHEGSMA